MVETYHSDVIEYFIWDLKKTSQRRTNGASKIRTTETSLGVSFETCLRRRRDALMGRHCYVFLRCCHDVPIRCREDIPQRRLGDVPPRSHWVFHLRRTCDVAGTYRETSLRGRYNVLLPGGLVQRIWLKTKNTESTERRRPTQTRTKQNNEHARIIRRIQLRKYLLLHLLKFIMGKKGNATSKVKMVEKIS